MQTTSNPFSLITEPTAVQRILLSEGLIDVASEIVGDGFCFVPIECPQYWGLVIAHKAPDGEVSHRVATCKKEAGAQRMSEGFAALMDDLPRLHGGGYSHHYKIESPNRN